MEDLIYNLKINFFIKMENKKILIATPCFGGMCHSDYALSLCNTISELRRMGYYINTIMIKNQLVQRARNMLTNFFLKSEFTHLLFIDSDIKWKVEDVLKLIQADKEVICALYPNKIFKNNYETQFSSNISIRDTKEGYDYNTNIGVIDLAATGFLMIHKNAFEKLKPIVQTYKNIQHNETLYDFWNCKIINNQWLTEDYYFSSLYNSINEKIYCDFSIQLVHIGTHEYTRNPIDFFKLNKNEKL